MALSDQCGGCMSVVDDRNCDNPRLLLRNNHTDRALKAGSIAAEGAQICL